MSVIKYLDTYEFVKQSKALGASEELSEYQVRQIEQAIENAVFEVKSAVASKNVATHADVRETELRLQKEIEVVRKDIKEVELTLQKEIEAVRKEIKEVELTLQKEIEIVRREISVLRYDTLKFTIWTGVGVVIILGGMLAKGFHWWS